MRHYNQLHAGGSARSCLAECSARVAAGPQLLWGSGLACSFLACLIFSFSALCVKLTGNRLPVLEVCLLRSSMSFGLSLLMMRALHVAPLFGQRRHAKLLFVRGCCGALAMTSYYVALFLLPLGDAVTINLIGPPVTAVVARVFLGEPLGYRGAAGCLVSMAGVLVLAHPPFLSGGGGHADWGPERALGTLAGVVSALLGAGSSMTIRLLGPSEPASVIALWFHTGTMLLSIVPLCIGWPDKAVLPSPRDGSLMVGVALTSTCAQLLGTRGLQLVVAAKAAAMGFTQVLYSYLMGAICFNERLSSTGVLGVLLILAGVLLVTMRGLTTGSSSAQACSSAAAEAAKATANMPAGAVQLLATAAGSCCMRPAAAGDACEKTPMLASWAAELPGSPELHGADAAVVIRSSSRHVSGTAGGPAAAASQQQADGGSGVGSQAPARMVSAFQQLPLQQQRVLDEAALTAHVAAALGGEQCPAVAAFHSLAASRQASVARRVSRSGAASRQASAVLPLAGPTAAAATDQAAFGAAALLRAGGGSLGGSLGCEAVAVGQAQDSSGGTAVTTSLAGWLLAARRSSSGGGGGGLQDSPLLVAVPAQEGVRLWQLSEALAGHWDGQQQQAPADAGAAAAEPAEAPAGGGGDDGRDSGADTAAALQRQASVRAGSKLARGCSAAAPDSA